MIEALKEIAAVILTLLVLPWLLILALTAFTLIMKYWFWILNFFITKVIEKL